MSDVLKEYLISLGFKVDEGTYRSFNAHITKTGANVAQLGLATTAAAVQIGIAVERTAKMYDELYYASQRTGSSVSTLKAYEFGAKQIGLTSEQARGSVEALAGSIRMNPGLAGLMRGMGIDPNNSQKAIIELTDRLRKQYGPNGYFIAARQAQMFGIDEGTFQQLWKNLDRLKMEQERGRQNQIAAGIDPDKAAVKFNKFSRELNNVYDRLGLIKDRIALDYLPAANWVIGATNTIIDKFNNAEKATNGWAGVILGFASALTIAKVALIPLLNLLGLGGALGAAGRIGLGALGLGGLLGRTALMGGGALGASALALGAIKYDSNHGNGIRSSLRSMLGIADPGETADTSSLTTKRDAAVKYFMAKGWTREQAIGIVANLFAESKLNRRSVGDGGRAYGIGQWHPDRQADFARWAGKDIRDSTYEEQLAFTHYEMTEGKEKRAGDALRRTRSAREAAGVVSSQYERPAAVGEAMRNRGALADSWASTVLASPATASNVNIAPNTNITITGVSDPRKAADLVGQENARSVGNLTRWGQGAIDNGAMPQAAQ